MARVYSAHARTAAVSSPRPLAPRPARRTRTAAPGPASRSSSSCPTRPAASTDVVGRMIAEYLGQRLGQNIVVENRPGKGATHRHVAGRQGRARRLHAAHVQRLRATRSRRALYGDLDYDPVERLHPHHARLAQSQRPGGQSELPGQDAGRLHRLCQGQPRQARLRDLGCRARATTSSARCWR